MKKIFAVMVTVFLAVVFTVPAYAVPESPPHVITITNTDSSVMHTYEAYRIFEGNLDTTDNILSNIKWSDGIVSGDFLAELKGMSEFSSCNSARDVAEVLASFENDSSVLDAFATITGKHLDTVAGTSTESSSPYKINVTGDGYYFIKDKNDTVTAQGETYSKYILNVVHDVTIEAKDDHLVPEKNIIENDIPVSTNAVSVGDEITFSVKIDIPKMNGYKAYTFIMNDTLSKGLEYKAVKSVSVGGKTLAENTDYTLSVEKNPDGTTSLTITFINFIQYKTISGKVEVKYTAVLDTDAVIGGNGNPNTVNFTYSNNPSSTATGNGGDTGITPDSETVTYTTSINILKVDGQDNTKLLRGAKFRIEGEKLNTVITMGTKFEKAPYTAKDNETADEDIYYLLDDGTYTTNTPEPVPAESYVLVHFTTITPTGENVDFTGTTDNSGKTNFQGLNSGTYTITEIEAPDGYNLLDNPISFGITWDSEKGFSVADSEQSGVTYNEAEKTFRITIENNSGSVLPYTGGIGTVIFKVIGGIFIAGAAVVLVSVMVSGRKKNT